MNGNKAFGLGVFNGGTGRAERMVAGWDDVLPDTDERFDEPTPIDIALDGAGDIYVYAEQEEYVDGYSSGTQFRVLKLNAAGRLLASWPIEPGYPLFADRDGIEVVGGTAYVNVGDGIASELSGSASGFRCSPRGSAA